MTISIPACQTSNQTIILNGKTRKMNMQLKKMESQCAIHLLCDYPSSVLFRAGCGGHQSPGSC